jgi:hypothetical protein
MDFAEKPGHDVAPPIGPPPGIVTETYSAVTRGAFSGSRGLHSYVPAMNGWPFYLVK